MAFYRLAFVKLAVNTLIPEGVAESLDKLPLELFVFKFNLDGTLLYWNTFNFPLKSHRLYWFIVFCQVLAFHQILDLLYSSFSLSFY